MLRTEHIIKDIVTKNGENDGHEFPPGETWDTLVESIQASNKEISEALQELDAVRIDGRWMGVSQETYSSFVKLVLLTAAEQGWSLEKIPCVEMAIELEKNGVCGQLTLQLLHKISIINQANVSIEDLDRQDWREMPSVLPAYSLKADVVCRNIAIGLLLEKNNWEDKNDFLGTWKSLLPDHFTPTMDMLQGECLEMNSESLGEHGKKATKTGVMKLSARELPRDPSERFRRLFNVQREWTYSAVQPYICNLTGPGQTVEELLLKYARPCQTHPADEVTYTAR
jgi:sister chromatid cohesion protein DCC1